MRRRPLILALAFAAAACGAASAPVSDPSHAASSDEQPPPVAASPTRGDWSSWTPIEKARVSWRRGRADSVARVAWDARGTSEDSAELRALGARGALATDCADQAIELVGESRDPELLRVAMHAHLIRDRWTDAARIAEAPELAGDPEATSVRRVATVAATRALWTISGPGCAEAPWIPDAPVAVAPITIDGVEVHALLATSEHTTRLSSRLRPQDGVLDALGVGAVTIRGVPYFSRDLSRESELAGVEIGAVLGRDVLFRWKVTFQHGVVRLGGPRRLDWDHRFGTIPNDIVGGAPSVTFAQCEHGSGATTCRYVGAIAIDSASPRALAIAEWALPELPLGFDEDDDPGSRAVHVRGFDLAGEGPVAPATVVSADAMRAIAPCQAVLGWPYISGGMQLGWQWFSPLAFDETPPDRCEDQPLTPGPRASGECFLDDDADSLRIRRARTEPARPVPSSSRRACSTSRGTCCVPAGS